MRAVRGKMQPKTEALTSLLTLPGTYTFSLAPTRWKCCVRTAFGIGRSSCSNGVTNYLLVLLSSVLTWFSVWLSLHWSKLPFQACILLTWEPQPKELPSFSKFRAKELYLAVTGSTYILYLDLDSSPWSRAVVLRLTSLGSNAHLGFMNVAILPKSSSLQLGRYDSPR